MKRLPLLALLLLLAACEGGRIGTSYAASVAGNAERGEALIRKVGCGSCHSIPGVRGADGAVGPPLDFWSRRTYIAGRIPNTPENLAHWVLDPQSVDPKTAMPDLGLTDAQAGDVVAYLYTLR